MKPKFLKQILKFTSALVAVVLLSAGCGGPAPVQQGPITLTFWKPFEGTDTMQPIIDAYRAVRPNVTIVYTKKSVDTYNQDLINALASGNGPDIFSINNSWVPSYMDKIVAAPDKTYNLTSYKKDFVDVAVADFTKDGKIYGVPMAIDSLALYYNKDLLGNAGIATPPKTWDELASDVQRIKKQDRTGYFTVSGAALGTNTNVNRSVDILYLLMLQQGVVPFGQDNTYPTFAQEVSKNGNYINPGVNALTYYTSFANPFSPNYTWNYKSDYSIDAFANGRAAFLYSYAFTRKTILQKNPNLNFDVTQVPQPSLDQPAVNYSNYWGEVVSKQSKNAEAAWDFLKFMTSKETLDKYYAQNKQPSSRRDLIELQIPDPEIGEFAHANLTSKAFYKPDQGKMDSLFGRMIDNVVLSNMKPEQALNQAEQQASAIVQERNQGY